MTRTYSVQKFDYKIYRSRYYNLGMLSYIFINFSIINRNGKSWPKNRNLKQLGDNFKNGRKIARKEKEKERDRKKRKKEKQNVAKLIGITITREMCLVILKKKKKKKSRCTK